MILSGTCPGGKAAEVVLVDLTYSRHSFSLLFTYSAIICETDEVLPGFYFPGLGLSFIRLPSARFWSSNC
jgi:hypothetical protein